MRWSHLREFLSRQADCKTCQRCARVAALIAILELIWDVMKSGIDLCAGWLYTTTPLLPRSANLKHYFWVTFHRQAYFEHTIAFHSFADLSKRLSNLAPSSTRLKFYFGGRLVVIRAWHWTSTDLTTIQQKRLICSVKTILDLGCGWNIWGIISSISLSAWFKGKESPGQAFLPLHCLTAQVLPGHLLL